MTKSELTDEHVIPTADLGDVIVSIGFLPLDAEDSKTAEPKFLSSDGIRFSCKGEQDVRGRALAEYWDWKDFSPESLDAIVAWVESYQPPEPETADELLEAFEAFLSSLVVPEIPPCQFPPRKPVFRSSQTKTISAMQSQTPHPSRRMQPVEVAITEDSLIAISIGLNDGPPPVLIHPAQVGLLCQWLEDAKAEIETRSANPPTGTSEP